MKNFNMKIVAVLSLFTVSISAFSQLNWRKGGNAQVPLFAPPSIGTNNTWNSPLRIITNGINRQIIQNGGNGANQGQIAMGNNLPNNFNPESRLHLHQTAGITTTRFTNGNTGFGAGDGFEIGILGNGHAVLGQREAQPMRFFTNGNEHARIAGNTVVNPGTYFTNPSTDYPVTEGNVGINTTLPMSMLHIGGM